MSKNEAKLPNPNAVKELHERHQRLKKERLSQYDKLAEYFKKKKPTEKVALPSNSSDVEI